VRFRDGALQLVLCRYVWLGLVCLLGEVMGQVNRGVCMCHANTWKPTEYSISFLAQTPSANLQLQHQHYVGTDTAFKAVISQAQVCLQRQIFTA